MKLSTFSVAAMTLALWFSSLTINSHAEAAVLFSENFSGTTPGANSSLSGSGFQVSAGRVDVVGNLNGSFFTYNGETGNNGVDLVGSPSAGTIESISIFTLRAGYHYQLTFRSVASGPLDPDPVFDNLAAVGSFQLLFSDKQEVDASNHYIVTQNVFNFTPTVTESNVRITLQSLENHGGGVNGSLIDDVVLTETAAAAVPEPSSLAVFLSVSIAAVWKRRSRRV